MWWGWRPKVMFAATRAEMPGRWPSESRLPPGRWRGAWRVKEQIDIVTENGDCGDCLLCPGVGAGRFVRCP